MDERARGRRIGEGLLLDALARVVEASHLVACLGIIVDAKTEDAVAFYERYGFAQLEDTEWPRRMFLALAVAQAAFRDT